MKKEKELIRLNACIDLLDDCDLGLSLVWLWTWSTIQDLRNDKDYTFNLTDVEIWERLVDAVDGGHEFSLEFGAEAHYENVVDWLQENDIIRYMEE